MRLLKMISAESETLQSLSPFNTTARFNQSCIAPLSSPSKFEMCMVFVLLPTHDTVNRMSAKLPSACIKLYNNNIQFAFIKNIDVSFAIRNSAHLDEIVTV